MKFSLLISLPITLLADDFAKWDQAVPIDIDVLSIAPVFDMDTDACYPAAAISREGEQNGGLATSGSITGDCRSDNFLDLSNTYHRHTCTTSGGNTYCAHMYALYFEKDQLFDTLGGGHRHDVEDAVIWTTNGVVTHGSYSAHGDLNTAPASEIGNQDGHLKFVYHKDGVSTHALRFADTNEAAENSYGTFVTPVVISWFEASTGYITNSNYRSLMNGFDFGSANMVVVDSRFLSRINSYLPSGYPQF
eukprot:snap_masked-scaffold_30-processed-gene-3.86-mRNA-1 protein AED:0.01 eAED:0.01 QI:0/-1/0/1/-1/1/1/0/247